MERVHLALDIDRSRLLFAEGDRDGVQAAWTQSLQSDPIGFGMRIVIVVDLDDIGSRLGGQPVNDFISILDFVRPVGARQFADLGSRRRVEFRPQPGTRSRHNVRETDTHDVAARGRELVRVHFSGSNVAGLGFAWRDRHRVRAGGH